MASLGVQVFYTFLEAAWPIEDDSITDYDKNEITRNWVENAINMQSLYDMFLTFFGIIAKTLHMNHSEQA